MVVFAMLNNVVMVLQPSFVSLSPWSIYHCHWSWFTETSLVLVLEFKLLNKKENVSHHVFFKSDFLYLLYLSSCISLLCIFVSVSHVFLCLYLQFFLGISRLDTFGRVFKWLNNNKNTNSNNFISIYISTYIGPCQE